MRRIALLSLLATGIPALHAQIRIDNPVERMELASLSLGTIRITCCAGNPQTGPLRIVVADPSGAPIPNARLIVLSSDGRLLAIRNVDDHGQATLDFNQTQYSLCVRSPGFSTREMQLDTTQQTSQLVPVILDVGHSCMECVTVRFIPADPPGPAPQLDLADDIWVADADGRIFLPHACMPEWARRTVPMEPLPPPGPKEPNLDHVRVSN